jgi:drug/metabolite transporter (DMT)-like permease
MPPVLETAVLTALALLAFASNSILTRLALGARVIDAASFTAVRLAAGALVLATLVRVRAGSLGPLRRQRWLGPAALFVYAAPFSFAYLRIGAAVGALVLFGTVQLTMIGWGVVKGERPTARTWAGLVLAAGGLAWLVAPAASRPVPLGVALMVTAGVAWGVYSLAGRGSPDLLIANARNFVWSVPMAAVLVGVAIRTLSVSARGLTLAAISGAITSGLGYAIWYRALRGLTATQAAVVQLSVPVIAAFGAVAFLGEHVSGRLMLAGVAVLGGVALVLSRPTKRA